MKVGIIGAGHRGRLAYGREINKYNNVEIVSIVDFNKITLDKASEEFNIKDEYKFNNADDFFKKLDEEKFIDTLFIATWDREHYDITMRALDYDIDILLEKPISPKPHEVIDIANKAQAKGNVFMICHVLRYSPFFRKIKEIIDNGTIGRIMSINHNENIGYFHFAHSFVRGNWGNEEKSSPLILQKSCHDMDILLYLTEKSPISINSYGSLAYFIKENQPEGASNRCVSCKYEHNCIYSATKFYISDLGRGWRSVVDPAMTKQTLKEALEVGPYGRCVWDCDNTVCDHQAISIEFEGDVEVVFNLTAFSRDVHRNIKIQGTKGEIIADDLTNEIIINEFGKDESTILKVRIPTGGHGGSDHEIIKAFVEGVNGDKEKIKTGAQESIMSHMMCFASEVSRKDNKRIYMDEYLGDING